MKTLILTLSLLFAAQIDCPAQRRQSTIRRNLKVEQTQSSSTKKVCKNIVAVEQNDPTTYRLSGFDKPVNSLYETMFFTNNSDQNIVGVFFTIEYFDRSGRQLNKMSKSLMVDIPAGQTRQIRWNSWDRQQSFFYIGSRQPRSRATGFDVKCRIDSVEIKR